MTRRTGILRPNRITKDELADLAELYERSDLRDRPEGLDLERLTLTATLSTLFVSTDPVFKEGVHVRDKIVGMATLATAATLHGLVGMVCDVVVLDRCRGQGIGWKLMHELMHHARQQHVHRLTATIGNDRPNAERLLTDLGFTRVGLREFQKRLD